MSCTGRRWYGGRRRRPTAGFKRAYRLPRRGAHTGRKAHNFKYDILLNRKIQPEVFRRFLCFQRPGTRDFWVTPVNQSASEIDPGFGRSVVATSKMVSFSSPNSHGVESYGRSGYFHPLAYPAVVRPKSREPHFGANWRARRGGVRM